MIRKHLENSVVVVCRKHLIDIELSPFCCFESRGTHLVSERRLLVSAGFELKISDHVRTVPGYSEFELGRSRDDFVLTRAPNEG